MSTPADTSAKQKKPWPMTWVAAAIIVYIVAYTIINLEYRKQEPPHEPWAEAQERKNSYVLSAKSNWTRFRAEIHPIAAASDTTPTADTLHPASVTVHATPTRLEDAVPLELAMIVPARPILYPSPDELLAPQTLAPEAPLAIQMRFDKGQSKREFGEFMAYARDNHLYLFLQDVERLPVGFEATPPASRILASLPAGALDRGSWKATLYSAQNTFEWEFEVR